MAHSCIITEKQTNQKKIKSIELVEIGVKQRLRLMQQVKRHCSIQESLLYSEVRQAWGICINQSFVQQPVLTSVFAL